MANERHATDGASSSGLLAWGLGLVAVIGIAGEISGLGVPDRDAVTESGVSEPAKALPPDAVRPVIADARHVLEGEEVAETTESARTTSSGAGAALAEAGPSTTSPPAVSTAAASPPDSAAEPTAAAGASAGAAGRDGAGDSTGSPFDAAGPGDQAIAVAGDRPQAGGDPSSALQPQAEGEGTAPAWRPQAVAAGEPVPGAADSGRQAAEREREVGTEAGTTPQGAPRAASSAVPPPFEPLAASSPDDAAVNASQGPAESVPEAKTQDPANSVAAPESASPSFRQPSAPAAAERPTGPTDPVSASVGRAEAPPASSYLWRSMSDAPSPRPTRPAAPMYPYGYPPGIPAPAVMAPPVLYPRWPVQGRQPIEPHYGPWGYRAYPGFGGYPGRDDR